MRNIIPLLRQLAGCCALLTSVLLNARPYVTRVPDEWLIPLTSTQQSAAVVSEDIADQVSIKNNASTPEPSDIQADSTTQAPIENDAKNTLIPQPGDIPADVAYWIADIKLNENGVTIIEFGDGNFAGYKVLDHMYRPGKMWEAVWSSLFSLEIPIWYVGDYASNPGVVAWPQFKAGGGFYSPSLTALQKNNYFLQHTKKYARLFSEQVKDYQGVIVFKRCNPSKEALNQFMTRYPDFLILNYSSTHHVSDKKLTDGLFNTPELRAFRPKAAIFPKKYTKTLASEIMKQFENDWLVIKPINAGRGNGIIMVDKDNLDDALHRILVENKNHLPPDNDIEYKPDPPLGYDYWKGDRNSNFLVEEYVPSKPISVGGKEYDATMRVIFIMRYEQGTITLDFLDAYWKRPIKALTDYGTFKDKHISKHAPNFEESQDLAVSPEDYEFVKESMAQALPQIYWNILATHYAE
jgi:hypothetical protein